MRRAILVLAALVAATLGVVQPATPAPRHPYADALDYDLAKVREAMTRGRQAAGDPPADAAAYFQNRPYHWVHPAESTTHTQPDGSVFSARVVELEEGGGQASLDGHLITQGDDGWWYYGTRLDTGRVSATTAIVGQDAAPAETAIGVMPDGFRQNLLQYAKYFEEMRGWMHGMNRAMAAEAKAAAEPVVFRVPALMLEVNGATFQPENTADVIQAKYSGIGSNPYGTVTEMYLEQSFGHMAVEVDVYGPYTSVLSQSPNDCWYGTDGGPILGEVAGMTTLGLGGYGAKGMAIEAVPQADPEVDFAQYDQNGDDYVDFLMIVHSGPGAETTGDPCDVHSHYFSGLLPALAGAPPEPTPASADGVLIGPVLTVPELESAIGVVAHEVMHALGEPDYYGTSGTVGTGDWDLGAGGSYGGIPTQTNPVHFNPVMKINFGWVEPRILSETTLDISLRPRASTGDMVMIPTRIEPAGSPDAALCDQAPIELVPGQNNAFYTESGDCMVEGYLFEHMNRAAALIGEDGSVLPTDFDRQNYGSGLFMWHWDMVNYVQLGNNNVLRPMLDILEFDRRDETQDLTLGITRADPLDPFWGDPVGVSAATATLAETLEIAPPDGSPYMVTATPGTGADTPEWTTPAQVPDGMTMAVTLDWMTSAADDWDLSVQKLVGGSWADAGSDGAPPASGPENVTFVFEPGATYRAHAQNFASVSQTAEVSIAYDTAGVTFVGPSHTLNNDLAPTGWQFTNIRSLGSDSRLANETELPGETVTFDAILHSGDSVDVSGDFLTVVADSPAPIVAGEPITLSSKVYNHGPGGTSATFALYDGDPANGGLSVGSTTIELGTYGRDEVEFTVTPEAGNNEYWLVAGADGDAVPANNAVKTEIWAHPNPSADVLLVDNDRNWTQEETYEAILQGLGVSYHVVHGEPSAETLAQYDGVIWITSTVSGATGIMSQKAVAALQAYFDEGGRVWLSSARVVFYLGNNLGQAQFLASYFGVVAVNNITNAFGTVTGAGDGVIAGSRTIDIGYIDGKAYQDYERLVTGEDGTLDPPLTVQGDAFPLFVHEAQPDFIVGARVEGGNGFRTVISFPLGTVESAAERVALMSEVLDYFEIDTGTAPPTAPSLRFERFAHVQVQQDWPVTIGAVAPGGVASVDLVYRTYGDTPWTTLTLDEVAPGVYGGTIPGADIWNNGLEYYARMTTADGAVVESAGGAELPNVASAPYGDYDANAVFGGSAPPTPGPTPPAPTPPAPPPPPPPPGEIPTTGGGFAIAGLLAALAAMARPRRRRTT